jgi:hypothetical protein
MISIDKCKEILGENMPDSEVERLRDALYAVVGSILDNYLEEFARIDTCKSRSFTAVSVPQNKAQKDMALIAKNIVAENSPSREVMKL